MDFKFSNSFFIKIPEDFLKDFFLEKDNLLFAVKDYVNNFYLQNKSRTFRVSLKNSEKIIFHKIQVKENNKSGRKSKRVLIFILLNEPEGKNTIFPLFSFSSQEEKRYTTQFLKSKDFVYTLFKNFEKYQKSLDITGNPISKTFGTKI